MHRDTHALVNGVKDDVAGLALDVKSDMNQLSLRLDGHINDDNKVADTVKRHTQYWRGVSSSATAILAYFGLVK